MHSFRKSIYKSNKVKELVLPPTVVVGADEELEATQNSFILSAIVTEGSGTIVSRQWTEITGATGFTITNPNNLNTDVTGLTGDNYTFRITVTDSNGLTASDDLVVTRVQTSQLIISATPTGQYEAPLPSGNGYTAGKTYTATVDPPLQTGESLTIEYEMYVTLYREVEANSDASGRAEILKSGTSIKVLNDSLDPGEAGLGNPPSLSLKGTNFFTLYPSDTLTLQYDNMAEAPATSTATANTDIRFVGATFSGTSRTISNLPEGRNFLLTESGGTLT